MDIVGVTASAAALLEITGRITKTITAVVNAVRTADSRLTALATELSQLTQYLQSVHKTLQSCRGSELSLIDDDLWRHSEVCLAGCQSTLHELAQMVGKVKDNARKVTRLGSIGWKARAALDLSLKGSEMDSFRDRIYKSNSALQTMLHTINVSLSINNNASQHSILMELSRLKSSIDAALQASSSLGTSFGRPAHGSTARNLHELASAARTFHCAATSSASTIRGDEASTVGSGTLPWQRLPRPPMSLQGDFPPWRRELVEAYVKQGANDPPTRQPSMDEPFQPQSPRPISPIVGPSRALFVDGESSPAVYTEEPGSSQGAQDDEEDEAEFERAFTAAVQQLALDQLRAGKFDKAVEFLLEAIPRLSQNAAENHHLLLHLDRQLALCYVFQRQITAAEPLIALLAESRAYLDVGALLHSLALSHLSGFRLDAALSSCRLALRCHRRRCKTDQADWNEYHETMGLLATIYDMMGEGIRAEVVRSQIPDDCTYRHPVNEIEYLLAQRRFMKVVLGEEHSFSASLAGISYEMDATPASRDPARAQDPTAAGTDEDLSSTERNRNARWDASCDVSRLRTNMSRHERLEMDTGKEVVFVPEIRPDEDIVIPSDADDESSPITPTQASRSPLKRHFSRFFRGYRHQTHCPDLYIPAASSSPNVSSDESGTPTKLSTWRYLKPSKSKATLKKSREASSKASSDASAAGTFRLLHMERIGTPRPRPALPVVREDGGDVAEMQIGEACSTDKNGGVGAAASSDGNNSGPNESEAGQDNHTPAWPLRSQSASELASTTAKTAPSKLLRPSDLRLDTEAGRTASRSANDATPGVGVSLSMPEAIGRLSSILSQLSAATAKNEVMDARELEKQVNDLQVVRFTMQTCGNDPLVVSDIDGILQRLASTVSPQRNITAAANNSWSVPDHDLYEATPRQKKPNLKLPVRDTGVEDRAVEAIQTEKIPDDSPTHDSGYESLGTGDNDACSSPSKGTVPSPEEPPAPAPGAESSSSHTRSTPPRIVLNT